jgi:menaquinone-dependent protoporphyrinogen oxidase
MIPVLIAYSTTEGQTRKVAEFMAEALAGQGYRADVVDVASEQSAAVQPFYAAAIVGGSVHLGRHSAALARFLRANAGWLASVPLAVFSVSLTAAQDDAESRVATAHMMEELLADTGLVPARTCRVAGALHYQAYGPVKRQLARGAARAAGLPAGKDVEYTDWEDIRRFAVEFVRDHGGAPREVA